MKTQVSPGDRQSSRVDDPMIEKSSQAEIATRIVNSPVRQKVPSPPSQPSSPSSYDDDNNNNQQRRMNMGASADNYPQSGRRDGSPDVISKQAASTQRETKGLQSSPSTPTSISSSSNLLKTLPPLFLYIETGDFSRAAERARRHPREVKAWVNIQTKSSSSSKTNLGNNSPTNSKAKRLALHQACFKLRHASSSSTTATSSSKYSSDDPFVDCCRLILTLIQLYPEAAGTRETRHGCLPLHLAAFASCTQPTSQHSHEANTAGTMSNYPTNMDPSTPSSSSSSSAAFPGIPNGTVPSLLNKPAAIANRSNSETTTASNRTTMSAAIAEERITGKQTDFVQTGLRQRPVVDLSISSNGTHVRAGSSRNHPHQQQQSTQSVSMGNNIFVSARREEWAVKVINALLDAYPRGAKMDSEGGRLPLHTACAGRATPRVVTTLVTAYPAACRQRNKDGYLPVAVASHWGISHPNVVVILLRSYPDATFGRNRWERTPLEEALCMAGENGRPHQAALVRALRKHPSYWTRPESVDLFGTRGRSQIVDIDETLASSADDSIDDEDLFIENGVRGTSRKTQVGRQAEGVEAMSAVVNDLPTLIQGQNWDGVIQRLKLHPSEAKGSLVVPTKGGFTATTDFYPLHFACERRPPIEVVQALLQLCPEASQKRSMPGGSTPLNIACTWYSDVNVIEALMAADRVSCKTLDELGNLPLHSACFSGTSTSVIESLLSAFPKAVLARNNQGSLPSDITTRLKHANRVATLGLLNLAREQVIAKKQQKHRRGRSDGYVLTAKVLNERFNAENDPFADVGVEIAYDGDKDQADSGGNDLLWI